MQIQGVKLLQGIFLKASISSKNEANNQETRKDEYVLIIPNLILLSL